MSATVAQAVARLANTGRYVVDHCDIEPQVPFNTPITDAILAGAVIVFQTSRGNLTVPANKLTLSTNGRIVLWDATCPGDIRLSLVVGLYDRFVLNVLNEANGQLGRPYYVPSPLEQRAATEASRRAQTNALLKDQFAGKTITSASQTDDGIVFEFSDGTAARVRYLVYDDSTVVLTVNGRPVT